MATCENSKHVCPLSIKRCADSLLESESESTCSSSRCWCADVLMWMWVGPQKVPIKWPVPPPPTNSKQKQVDPHARGCSRSSSSYKWRRVDPHVAPHLASGLAANSGTLSLCNLRHSMARDNGPFIRWPVGQTSNVARIHRGFFNWFRPSNVAQTKSGIV